MYAGHAAVALALKAREPRVPLAPLVVACYGPDWLETVLGLWRGRLEMGLYTHYIPGVVAGAILAAVLYRLVFRRPGAMVILAGWLLHWPADFFTAYKGLLAPNDRVGLDLYHLPAADFALETLLIIACCVVYARAFADTPARRRWAAGMASALIILQGLLDVGMSHEPNPPWSPSLARAWRQPHLVTMAAPASRRPRSRMALALSRPTPTASEQWQRREPAAS